MVGLAALQPMEDRCASNSGHFSSFSSWPAAATGSGGGNRNQITSELLREADPEGLSVYQIIERN